MNKLTTTAATLALLSGAAFTPIALADDGYSVAYSSTQLSSTEGMRSLHQQIRTTAKNYCPSYNEKGKFRQVKNCVADVVEDLVEKINQPVFTAYVESQSSGDQSVLLAGRDID